MSGKSVDVNVDAMTAEGARRVLSSRREGEVGAQNTITPRACWSLVVTRDVGTMPFRTTGDHDSGGSAAVRQRGTVSAWREMPSKLLLPSRSKLNPKRKSSLVHDRQVRYGTPSSVNLPLRCYRNSAYGDKANW